MRRKEKDSRRYSYSFYYNHRFCYMIGADLCVSIETEKEEQMRSKDSRIHHKRMNRLIREKREEERRGEEMREVEENGKDTHDRRKYMKNEVKSEKKMK